MPARRAARTRLLAAALTALAALALTGCRDGEGLRDEGPSHAGLPKSSAPYDAPAGKPGPAGQRAPGTY
ncbi:hypothetical protein [Streptomyces griseus]|uniref:hypothetical protein n=1 Tax=Streptomyces griseus TaxID=1911 RepID=UPI000560964F|nr:hypothetical protein [Streptomyces griseus]